MPPKKAVNFRTEDASGPLKQRQARGGKEASQSPGFSSLVAFQLFLIARCLAAYSSPIQDCDEVFNYWEPSHYLNHGYGLQTWEYSPEYAIRSWAYAGIHSLMSLPGRLIPGSPKAVEFYVVRFGLALLCALCETKLYATISRAINSRVAVFFLIVMVFSPGMFHASAAYLPSSFAMYTTMLGMSAFMDWRRGLRTNEGIMWFGIGAILGWPFAAALVAPFVVEEIVFAWISGAVWECFRRVLDGTVRSSVVLFFEVGLDSCFYRKLVCVPLNIIWYNIFSGGSKGPNIYGTEPWHFYVRNLLLNFNAWFVLALAAFPLVLLQRPLQGQSSQWNLSRLRSFTFTSPFYLWMAIFTLQPHKEERFMYPAYPALALNAAMSFHILLAKFGSQDPKSLFSRVPPVLKLSIVSLFVLGTVNLGILRSVGMATAYSAPLAVYGHLQARNAALKGNNVCVGKEWYRYPSSYFLPNHMRAKFVRSEFKGLLPGEFSEAKTGFGLFPGAWLMPSGMNDENIEDPAKYTNIEHCRYLIDSQLGVLSGSPSEPDYVLDTATWNQIVCKPFLDQSQTSVIGRLLWLPDWEWIPERHRPEIPLLMDKGYQNWGDKTATMFISHTCDSDEVRPSSARLTAPALMPKEAKGSHILSLGEQGRSRAGPWTSTCMEICIMRDATSNEQRQRRFRGCAMLDLLHSGPHQDLRYLRKATTPGVPDVLEQ